jgi:hypothetical protein
VKIKREHMAVIMPLPPSARKAVISGDYSRAVDLLRKELLNLERAGERRVNVLLRGSMISPYEALMDWAELSDGIINAPDRVWHLLHRDLQSETDLVVDEIIEDLGGVNTVAKLDRTFFNAVRLQIAIWIETPLRP